LKIHDSTSTRGNDNTRCTYAFDAQRRLASIQRDPAGTDQDIGFTYNQAGQIRARSVCNPGLRLADVELVEKKYISATGRPVPVRLTQYDRISSDDR